MSSAPFGVGPGSFATGEVVNKDCEGRLFVEFPRNPLGPLEARTVVEELCVGARVLLVFDGGDPTRPIVLGILHDRAKTTRTLHLKASRILIEAEDDLILTCGDGSFRAQRDGRVHIKGRDVSSRAARTNKVKGSIVSIN